MAQSYTRQSTFVDGDTITAALFNNEYNQLENAFTYSSSSATTTGHRHDGTAGHGGNVHTIGDLDFLNKIVVDSTNNRWGFFVEVSSSAVEQIRIQDGAVVPVTDNDIDLGTSSLEFKDLFLDGTAHVDTLDVDANGTVAGTFGVTGATTLSSTLAVTGAVTGSSTIQGTTITATTAFVPDASDGAALGTSSLEFSDLFLADGAVVNFGDDQDVTLTHVADTGLLLSSTDQLQFGDSGTYIHQSADGVLDLVSDTEIELNATTIDINGAVDISGTLGVAGGSTNGLVLSQGAISLKNGGTQSYIDFYCESSNAHYARLQAPAHSAFSGNITATLPATTGTVALTSDIHTTEELQDIIGAMFSSNTETDITVTYQDADGTIDLVVGTLNQDTTGTAALATSVTVSANNSTDETIFPVFVDGATGSQGLETDTGFTYNPSSGNLTVGGAVTAASLDISGDVDVDGTLEADAITVNGTTLAETISDTVGAMVGSNTETGISVTYDDSDNTLDFVIGSDVIVNSMIADDAIDSAQLADGSIDTAHIANDQVTGDKLANDITIANNLTVAGNLAVTGTTTQTGSVVSDSNFTGLTDENTGNSTDFGFYGKYVESSTTKYAGLFYDASTDNTFRLFTDTQTVPSTTVNTGATGYAAASLVVNSLTGTIATAAQPNITSLGTLTALTGGTGDFNWDSNTLVVDSSANRVGILNASPDVSLDIGSATDAVHVPSGTTAQRPTGAAGYFRYNSTTSKFEGYTDSWGSIGGGSGTNMDTNIFAGDGSDTTFTLSNAPDDEQNLMVFVDGVFQAHDAYSVSGTTLTFSAAPANGRVITVYHSTTTVGGSNNTINTMTGDNSDTTLTLSVAPVHENNVQVYFDGVYQSKSNYSISGTTLTFSTAPPTGVLVEAITNTNTSSTTANQLIDADSDTKIQVEESSDEDKIRFDVAGTEEMVMDATGIVINDGSNDRDFRIESNGNANMFFLDGGNDRVGIGTAPDSVFHVEGSGVDSLRFGNIGTSSNSALRISRDDTSITSGNPLGYLEFGGKDTTSNADTAHAYVAALASGTHAAGDNPTDLTFGTTPDGSSTMAERMRIDSAGSVGIGSTSPAAAKFSGSATPVLQVKGATPAIAVTESDVSDAEVYMGMAGGNAYFGSTGSGTLQIGKGATSTVNAMIINNDGHVTMPLQPAFSAIALGQSNLANSTQIHFDAETFDRNADYNHSTSVFAAPVDGTYYFSVNIRLVSVTADASYIIIRLVTSNINYDWIIDPRPGDATWDYLNPTINVVADLDASDTAYVYYYQSGGTFNNDIAADTGHFAGYLVG